MLRAFVVVTGLTTLAVAGLGTGCQDPCVTLAERICNCEATADERRACITNRITNQQGSVEVSDGDREFCQSVLDTGEDFTTMGQALLYAGARNVVATLWRIDDNAAAEFAGRFYDVLTSRSAADALATAQRAMIGDPELRSPYLWAAYQVSGNGGQTFNPANARVGSDKR